MSTPAELVANNVVLTPTEAATVLNLRVTSGAHKGEPSRRAVVNLVNAGTLRLVDENQPPTRWTISVAEVLRYLEGRPSLRIVGGAA